VPAEDADLSRAHSPVGEAINGRLGGGRSSLWGYGGH
jgi:hypothetical protein